ncbi:hypothetical protein [Streptomyces sp. G1]|uniref:hypothetical protein n=1 Tax=Streptomyces TaxID=1883 RepID=UPI00202F508F|nr:hypothetical protein [Streptomyces sp. G1]MCM1976392.1 hypothetical protein [Streptomyces sp. G1]
MALRFWGKDPNSDTGQCPSVWVDQDTGDVVVQGWKATDAETAECRESGDIPDSEAVVRLPAAMTEILRKACDDADRRRSGL